MASAVPSLALCLAAVLLHIPAGLAAKPPPPPPQVVSVQAQVCASDGSIYDMPTMVPPPLKWTFNLAFCRDPVCPFQFLDPSVYAAANECRVNGPGPSCCAQLQALLQTPAAVASPFPALYATQAQACMAALSAAVRSAGGPRADPVSACKIPSSSFALDQGYPPCGAADYSSFVGLIGRDGFHALSLSKYFCRSMGSNPRAANASACVEAAVNITRILAPSDLALQQKCFTLVAFLFLVQNAAPQWENTRTLAATLAQAAAPALALARARTQTQTRARSGMELGSRPTAQAVAGVVPVLFGEDKTAGWALVSVLGFLVMGCAGVVSLALGTRPALDRARQETAPGPRAKASQSAAQPLLLPGTPQLPQSHTNATSSTSMNTSNTSTNNASSSSSSGPPTDGSWTPVETRTGKAVRGAEPRGPAPKALKHHSRLATGTQSSPARRRLVPQSTREDPPLGLNDVALGNPAESVL